MNQPIYKDLTQTLFLFEGVSLIAEYKGETFVCTRVEEYSNNLNMCDRVFRFGSRVGAVTILAFDFDFVRPK